MCFEWLGRRGIFCTFLITVFVVSCSVKEDRRDCPCLLAVKLSDLPPGPVEYRLEGMDGSLLARGAAARDSVLYFKVPRDGVRLTAVSGCPMADKVQIPYGAQCPPVYLYSGVVSTDYESVLVEPHLRKHFCRLYLVLDGPPGDGKPITVMVRGTVNGIGLDGRPSAGEFNCPVGDSCLLPRQAQADILLLDIVMEDQVVRTFSLGKYMRDAGYDWTETDLSDITLTVSLSVTHISFHIQDWSHTLSMNVEI